MRQTQAGWPTGQTCRCTGCCSLADPWRLDPLGMDVVQAAVLQDEGWQGVQPCQLLQRHLICGVMCPGTPPALVSLLLYTPPQQCTPPAHALLVRCGMSEVGNQICHFAAPVSKECWLDTINRSASCSDLTTLQKFVICAMLRAVD